MHDSVQNMGEIVELTVILGSMYLCESTSAVHCAFLTSKNCLALIYILVCVAFLLYSPGLRQQDQRLTS